MRPEFRAFDEVGTAGCYVAIDIDFLRPAREMSTIPAGWVKEYVQGGLMTLDPALHWAMSNSGMCRWSELEDTHGVLDRAASWGLRYGASLSLSTREGQKRSFAFLAREDREISDNELAKCFATLEELHDFRPKVALTRAEISVLDALLKGQRIKSIAFDFGVTEGAIKQRLRNARAKLGASTATQATTMAQDLGLI
jgi:LuxR family transcriptional regulator, quorum-sensing system regulator SdiA